MWICDDLWASLENCQGKILLWIEMSPPVFSSAFKLFICFPIKFDYHIANSHTYTGTNSSDAFHSHPFMRMTKFTCSSNRTVLHHTAVRKCACARRLRVTFFVCLCPPAFWPRDIFAFDYFKNRLFGVKHVNLFSSPMNYTPIAVNTRIYMALHTFDCWIFITDWKVDGILL